MKGTDLALALGITPQMVSKLRRRGMPTSSVEAAQKWRRRHLEAARVKDQRVGIIAAPPAATDLDDDPPRADDGEDYRRARAAREQTRAEREALELEQLRGKLIAVDEAARIAFTAFRGLRDAIESVPARVKDALAAESDPFRLEQTLSAELAAVLGAFDPATAVSERDDDDD
jgi:phage terminase Nu1 subunit (DNA packaging protein)